MTLSLLIALQAAASAPAGAVPVEFDLARAPPRAPAQGCAPGDASEIVVCGRRGNPYRLHPLGDRYDEKPIVAETSIGRGASVRAYGDSVEMPGGQVSKRAMVGVKLRF